MTSPLMHTVKSAMGLVMGKNLNGEIHFLQLTGTAIGTSPPVCGQPLLCHSRRIPTRQTEFKADTNNFGSLLTGFDDNLPLPSSFLTLQLLSILNIASKPRRTKR
ncbi:hypothetical protein ACHAXM_001596 [Skeletonema potamos]